MSAQFFSFVRKRRRGRWPPASRPIACFLSAAQLSTRQMFRRTFATPRLNFRELEQKSDIWGWTTPLPSPYSNGDVPSPHSGEFAHLPTTLSITTHDLYRRSWHHIDRTRLTLIRTATNLRSKFCQPSESSSKWSRSLLNSSVSWQTTNQLLHNGQMCGQEIPCFRAGTVQKELGTPKAADLVRLHNLRFPPFLFFGPNVSWSIEQTQWTIKQLRPQTACARCGVACTRGEGSVSTQLSTSYCCDIHSLRTWIFQWKWLQSIPKTKTTKTNANQPITSCMVEIQDRQGKNAVTRFAKASKRRKLVKFVSFSKFRFYFSLH